MKKLPAILLLTIHLFNFAGYSIIFQYFIHRSETRLVAKIDAGSYDRTKLTILKIPVRIQYHNDWGDYERVDGEIEIDGKHYRYVERKLSKDTIYLACLPDESKTNLSKAENEYAKKVNAIPAEKNSNDKSIKKSTLGSEYNDCSINYAIYTVTVGVAQTFEHLPLQLRTGFLDKPFSPPDFI